MWVNVHTCTPKRLTSVAYPDQNLELYHAHVIVNADHGEEAGESGEKDAVSPLFSLLRFRLFPVPTVDGLKFDSLDKVLSLKFQ